MVLHPVSLISAYAEQIPNNAFRKHPTHLANTTNSLNAHRTQYSKPTFAAFWFLSWLHLLHSNQRSHSDFCTSSSDIPEAWKPLCIRVRRTEEEGSPPALRERGAKRGFSPVRALLMWARTAALWRVQQSTALAAAHPTPDLPTPPARSKGRPAGGNGVSDWK
jgi:hypothetical protein